MSRLSGVASALFVLISAGSVVGAQQAGTAAPRTAPKTNVPRAAGARPNVLAVIQGSALSASDAPAPETLVRLRDARFGRIVETLVTDKSGKFAFNIADPGSYVVEMLRNDQTLLASSQILSVNAGETVSAIVKLPFRVTPFAGLLNSSIAPSAAMMATQAAATGISAVVPTQPVSPNQ